MKAQLSVDRTLKSNQLLGQNQFPYLSYQSVDNDIYIEEDVEALKKGKEFNLRFGIVIELNVDLFKEALRTSFPDGSSIYRLGLSSKKAKTLNLVFNSFDLPSGAWMHIYNPSKTLIIGAFTEENENDKYLFATTILPTDSLVIEVFLPDDNAFKSVFIKSLIHGYRAFNDVVEAFGESGDCNINVACPEGSAWSDQIRGIVLIVAGIGNNEICSGSLINNTRNDGTPYLLSANHCPLSPTNVVVFNYQSPDCQPGSDSSFSQSINGLDILARNGKSDFLLAKLSSSPPNSYRPFYTGWNNSGIRPNEGTGIHHPNGDIKKISLDFKPSISKTYYNVGSDHWMVSSWDLGTTEPVSSGSPLFDEHKFIVGQLHGGDALCQFPDDEDYYGKFSVSWDHFPDSNRQLKYWLDPENSGAKALHGYDPLLVKNDFDLALMGFKSPSTSICGADSVEPEVIIQNVGNLAVDSFNVLYYLNNSIVLSESIMQTIAPGGTYIHKASSIPIANGFYSLKAQVTLNSPTVQNLSNDWAFSQLSVSNESASVELVLQTDNDGSESNWEIISSSGSQLASGGNYQSIPGGELIRDTFCLFDGCFTFNFYDDFGDGICCGFGNGYYLMRDVASGDTLFSNYAFTSGESNHAFCLGDSCSIRARPIITNTSVTNATNGSISLELLSGIPPYSYLWSNGDTTSQIENLPVGSYWVYIKDALNCADSLFFEVGIGSYIESLAQTKEKERIMVFPNPSYGNITIEGLPLNSNYKVVLFDQSGREMQRMDKTTSKEHETLNFETLTNGIYHLRILTQKQVYQQRIMILK